MTVGRITVTASRAGDTDERSHRGLIALSLLCSFSDAARSDDAFRCGNTLVKLGMTRAEVRQLCGEPTAKADEVQDVRSGGRLLGTTTLHRWTYTDYSKTRVLTFDEDVLKSIENE